MIKQGFDLGNKCCGVNEDIYFGSLFRCALNEQVSIFDHPRKDVAITEHRFPVDFDFCGLRLLNQVDLKVLVFRIELEFLLDREPFKVQFKESEVQKHIVTIQQVNFVAPACQPNQDQPVILNQRKDLGLRNAPIQLVVIIDIFIWVELAIAIKVFSDKYGRNKLGIRGLNDIQRPVIVHIFRFIENPVTVMVFAEIDFVFQVNQRI